MTRSGLFLSFEGVEGGGKSTQMRLLCERLRAMGLPVTENVEPGGTRIGKQIRALLLEAANQDLRPSTELLLFFASRAQAVEQVIRPALAAGHVVVSDRFTDSSYAYQGIARGLGVEWIRELEKIACQGVRPERTLCLDLDVEIGLERARARNREAPGSETRLDDESVQFHRKVRDGYHQLAWQEPERFLLVDAAPPVEEVAESVWARVSGLIAGRFHCQ